MNDYEQRQRQALIEGREALERTSQSLLRSERAAIETEYVGTTVINELGQQRETLIRASNRLSNIDESLSESKRLINFMKRSVLTNKVTLIFIIICEIGILSCLVYLRFFK